MISNNRVDELEAFKKDINLLAFASNEFSYKLSVAESSDVYAVLRKGQDDKIIVTKCVNDDHWIYFHVHDGSDRGSIIDLVQKRCSINLGRVRSMLRPWIGKGHIKATSQRFPSVKASNFMREVVISTYSKALKLSNSDYLLSRGILKETLESRRFSNMIRSDERGNTIFPHFDAEGITGYEIKNDSYSGFAKRGRRSLWSSQCFQTDTHAVFVESALDGLSYLQIKGEDHYRCHSVAGAIGGMQQPMIKAVLEKCQRNRLSVISAFDNDENGEKYDRLLNELAPEGLTLTRDRPKLEDWNKGIDRRGGLK